VGTYLGRALSAGLLVANDVVDQRIVQDLQVFERVDQAANVVIGVLQEPGLHLHLPGQDGSFLDRRLPRKNSGPHQLPSICFTSLSIASRTSAIVALRSLGTSDMRACNTSRVSSSWTRSSA
jgi:hypothetical protein